MPSDDFSQSREDAIDAEMQRDERREMQDPVMGRGAEEDEKPAYYRAGPTLTSIVSKGDDPAHQYDDLDPEESCLAPMSDAEAAGLEYAQDAAGDDWHLCMLTPQPKEYEL